MKKSLLKAFNYLEHTPAGSMFEPNISNKTRYKEVKLTMVNLQQQNK